MMSIPGEQHKWLEKFLGEWTIQGVCDAGPGQPEMKHSGEERVRSLGGMWIVAEGRMEMPGAGEGTMITTLGFDKQRGRFVGTWVGSMMDHMWVYEGELDASGRILTLSTEGPEFGVEGKMAKYRDVHEFKSDDHRTLTSAKLGDDGEWRQFMRADYRRTK
ncbi:MAG: DUF1579 family protein [Phycisphaerales bacterium]|nr:DUF1579 family protein [Phycisphaerales bacterium]